MVLGSREGCAGAVVGPLDSCRLPRLMLGFSTAGLKGILRAPVAADMKSAASAHDLACPCWHGLVQEIEQRHVVPELYPYGSRGPVGAHYLAAKYGVRWGDLAADDE